jgi:hypothetical protein
MIRCMGTGGVRLSKGEHEITLRYEGGREEAAPGSVGVDFIWLARQ